MPTIDSVAEPPFSLLQRPQRISKELTHFGGHKSSPAFCHLAVDATRSSKQLVNVPKIAFGARMFVNVLVNTPLEVHRQWECDEVIESLGRHASKTRNSGARTVLKESPVF